MRGEKVGRLNESGVWRRRRDSAGDGGPRWPGYAGPGYSRRGARLKAGKA